jgi:hypothetical protein
MGKGGWSFVGNTLTTVIPVSTTAASAAKITVEVRRAKGLTARRAELDGFAGAMTRLRGAYDALQQSYPFASAPDPVIDAMQTGDRLGYNPEFATVEVTHFHSVLIQAQVSVKALERSFSIASAKPPIAFRPLVRGPRSSKHKSSAALTRSGAPNCL